MGGKTTPAGHTPPDRERGGMRIHPQPVRNDRECVTLAEDGDFFYDAISQPLRTLLVLAPKADPGIWLWGWVYPRNLKTVQGALADWNPQLQDEPKGFIKRSGSFIRRAPLRHRDPHYNRERCAHGRYVSDRDCGRIQCPAWDPASFGSFPTKGKTT